MPIPPEPPFMMGHRMHQQHQKFRGMGPRRILIDDSDEEVKLLIMLPGIDKSSLKVRVNNEYLVYSASIKEDISKLMELEKFNGRVPLYDEVDSESVKAKYEDGILFVTLKKVETGNIVEIE